MKLELNLIRAARILRFYQELLDNSDDAEWSWSMCVRCPVENTDIK